MKNPLRKKPLLVLGFLVLGFSAFGFFANTPKASAAGYCDNSPLPICQNTKEAAEEDDESQQDASLSNYCDRYKDDNLNIACESGLTLGMQECDEHYDNDNKYTDACAAGAQAANDSAKTKPSKQKASEKLKKAKQKQKKAEKAEKKTKKTKEEADKKVKKECKKGGNPKKCAAAKKEAAAAKKKYLSAKKVAATTKGIVTSLSRGVCKPKKFFGLTPWYAYLGDEFSSSKPGVNDGDACTLKCFNFLAQKTANDCGVRHSDIPYVLLAVVDSLLRVAGILAVVFVIVGAIKYITSSGNPEQTASAQSTIINALVGLAIALVAVAFISFIGSRLT